MLAKTTKELYSVEGHDFLPVVAVITPAEGNALIADSKQPVVGNGDLVGVPAKVFHN